MCWWCVAFQIGKKRSTGTETCLDQISKTFYAPERRQTLYKTVLVMGMIWERYRNSIGMLSKKRSELSQNAIGRLQAYAKSWEIFLEKFANGRQTIFFCHFNPLTDLLATWSILVFRAPLLPCRYPADHFLQVRVPQGFAILTNAESGNLFA